MKRFLLFTIFLLFVLTGKAQVTLEQTYNHSGTLTEISDDEFKYFVMDVPKKEVRLYNEDHTIYKTISLAVPSGYYLYDIKFITRHLFNTNDELELLYIYNMVETVDNQTVYTYGMKVITENGSVLLNLPNGGFAEVKAGSDGPKLLAYEYIWYDSYYLIYTNVYALGGSTKNVEKTDDLSARIYPNPAGDDLHIEIPGITGTFNSRLIITDMSGRQVMARDLPAFGNNLIVPTGKLTPGTYVVNVISDDGVLVSEKFEKK